MGDIWHLTFLFCPLLPVSSCVDFSDFLSASRARAKPRRRWWIFFFFSFLNLLGVCCWRVCVSIFLSFEATPLQVCGRLGYLKSLERHKKEKRQKQRTVDTCKPSRHSSRWSFYLVHAPRARSSCLRIGARFWDVVGEMLLFFFFFLFFCFLQFCCFSSRLRCPVMSDYELYKTRTRTRRPPLTPRLLEEKLTGLFWWHVVAVRSAESERTGGSARLTRYLTVHRSNSPRLSLKKVKVAADKIESVFLFVFFNQRWPVLNEDTGN